MATKEEELFTELRAVCNSNKTPRGWIRISSLIDHHAGYTTAFERNFEPAIRSLLDTTWCDTLRVAYSTTSPRMRRLSKIFFVQLGAPQITKKFVASTVKDIAAGVPEGHYNGLHYDRIKGLAGDLTRSLLETKAFGPIEHFFAFEIDDSRARRSKSAPGEQADTMIQLILERDAANLRSFGGDLSRASWRNACERVDEMRALETLFCEPPMLLDLLDRLTPLEIKRLGFVDVMYPDIISTILDHDFSAHLEAVSGWWAGPHLSFQRWVEDHHMGRVDRWCVHDRSVSYHDLMVFDEERAIYWEDRLGGVEKHPLEARACALEPLDPEALHEILFDEEGTLRGSDLLEALVVPEPLFWDDIRALFAQAPDAWPNLRFLSLANAIDADEPTPDDLDIAPLLSQLENATWKETSPRRTSAEFERFGTLEYRVLSAKKKVSDYKAVVEPYIDGFVEGRWHPVIAMRLARRIVKSTRSKSTMRALAKMVGMSTTASDERDALAPQVLHAIIATFAPEGIHPSPYYDDIVEFRELLRATPNMFIYTNGVGL